MGVSSIAVGREHLFGSVVYGGGLDDCAFALGTSGVGVLGLVGGTRRTLLPVPAGVEVGLA